jgi:hypothetical protein
VAHYKGLYGRIVVTPNVFLSVGTPFLPKQEAFVQAIEQHLRTSGLTPRAIDRTDYRKAGEPLNNTVELMKECSGTVVIAFERKYIRDGAEKRDSPNERQMVQEKTPTVWNHIEAAQAYMLDHPVLVIAEDDLHREGLLEDRYDWYVQWASLDLSTLNHQRFKGIFEKWKAEVEQYHQARQERNNETVTELDPSRLTVGQLIGALTTGQLWAIVAAIFTAASAIAVTAYKLGAMFAGGP